METKNITPDCKGHSGSASKKRLEDQLKFWVDKKSSRIPVPCPVHTCEHNVGSRSVLAHYVLQHQNDEEHGTDCIELFEGEAHTLFVNPADLPYRKNVVIGVVAYGGVKEQEGSCFADRGLCVYNTFLPPRYEKFAAHCPIFIYARSTSLCEVLKSSQKHVEVKSNTANECYRQLFLWCSSVDGTANLKCFITIDNAETSSHPVNRLRKQRCNKERGIPENALKVGVPSFSKKFVMKVVFLESGPFAGNYLAQTDNADALKKSHAEKANVERSNSNKTENIETTADMKLDAQSINIDSKVEKEMKDKHKQCSKKLTKNSTGEPSVLFSMASEVDN